MEGTTAYPLDGGVRASSTARGHLRLLGVGWDADLLDSALVATSELVTNATLHGGGNAVLTIRASGRAVRVEVYDDDDTDAVQLRRGRPATDPAGLGLLEDELLGGRGLQIVAALSERWGVTRRPPGKYVWFELLAPGPPGSVAPDDGAPPVLLPPEGEPGPPRPRSAVDGSAGRRLPAVRQAAHAPDGVAADQQREDPGQDDEPLR